MQKFYNSDLDDGERKSKLDSFPNWNVFTSVKFKNFSPILIKSYLASSKRKLGCDVLSVEACSSKYEAISKHFQSENLGKSKWILLFMSQHWSAVFEITTGNPTCCMLKQGDWLGRVRHSRKTKNVVPNTAKYQSIQFKNKIVIIRKTIRN